MARCIGHCCRGFTLNVPPGDLVERSYRDDDTGWQARILLGCLVYDSTGETKEGDTFVRYNSRNLLPNGDCGVYGKPERPEMCARYPCDGVCSFPGCTYQPEAPCAASCS